MNFYTSCDLLFCKINTFTNLTWQLKGKKIERNTPYSHQMKKSSIKVNISNLQKTSKLSIAIKGCQRHNGSHSQVHACIYKRKQDGENIIYTGRSNFCVMAKGKHARRKTALTACQIFHFYTILPSKQRKSNSLPFSMKHVVCITIATKNVPSNWIYIPLIKISNFGLGKNTIIKIPI